ncbi:hypothetical protein LINPERHAP2_LOCUS21973 [Linum perenne]
MGPPRFRCATLILNERT